MYRHRFFFCVKFQIFLLCVLATTLLTVIWRSSDSHLTDLNLFSFHITKFLTMEKKNTNKLQSGLWLQLFRSLQDFVCLWREEVYLFCSWTISGCFRKAFWVEITCFVLYNWWENIRIVKDQKHFVSNYHQPSSAQPSLPHPTYRYHYNYYHHSRHHPLLTPSRVHRFIIP